MLLRVKDLSGSRVYASSVDMKTAIQTGDAQALRRLLQEDPSRTNQLIEWGEQRTCLTHPLHFVSDMLFSGQLAQGADLPLIDALIQVGADLDFQRNGAGDTPLIGAASLGAEDVGIRLLEAGAQLDRRGLFGETALHWAALLGEDRLVAKLVERSRGNPGLLTLTDEKYQSTPLGWAIHGRDNAPAGNRGRQREVIDLLRAAGAIH